MRITEVSEINFTNWIFPKDFTLHDDYVEYKKKEDRKWKSRAQMMGFRFPIFEDFESFVRDLRQAQVITLDEKFDSQIRNRSHTGSIESLKSLVSGYQMPRDVDRIVSGFKNNDPIPYPIVLKGSKGMWIMAGNTRLDTAFILGATPKVLLVDVENK